MMKLYLNLLLFCWLALAAQLAAEPIQKIAYADTLAPVQIEHADPVFDDLTTDLGARKGENQLNVNLGYGKLRQEHHELLAQLEYEVAPANNFGIEITIPYTMYLNNQLSEIDRPGNRLEFLQWGAQYTFYASPEKGISMAVSFRNTFEMHEPDDISHRIRLESITYYPFFIAAKNWHDQLFLLLYGGAAATHELGEGLGWTQQFNAAFHYGFSRRDNYIGFEINNIVEEGALESIIRPQIILQVFQDYNVGVTVGIPVVSENIRWSSFVRLAYQF